mgnify:CR=1 FL=1
MNLPRMTRRSWIWTGAMVGVAALVFLAWDLFTYGRFIDAFSGATPSALHYPPPDGLEILVDGQVQRTWKVTSRSLRLLAPVRVRTREVTPDGRIMGSYAYTGVPVMHILAGVDPRPLSIDPDDRPLDMLVVFASRDGKCSVFTYGELVLADDALPVTLAWKREPVLPERNADTYKGNRITSELSGMRLVCPRETDTARYLDDVVRITLEVPAVPRDRLPPVRKHSVCRSEEIICIEGKDSWIAVPDDFPRKTWPAWFRIGHGMGIRSARTARADGVALNQILKKWFPQCGADDFFLVSGCDGYRVLLSAREVFADPRGERFLLVDKVDGAPLENGLMLGVFGDFYIDRCVRGVSHVVRLPAPLKVDR